MIQLDPLAFVIEITITGIVGIAAFLYLKSQEKYSAVTRKK